jgi:hypothetical protein
MARNWWLAQVGIHTIGLFCAAFRRERGSYVYVVCVSEPLEDMEAEDTHHPCARSSMKVKVCCICLRRVCTTHALLMITGSSGRGYSRTKYGTVRWGVCIASRNVHRYTFLLQS